MLLSVCHRLSLCSKAANPISLADARDRDYGSSHLPCLLIMLVYWLMLSSTAMADNTEVRQYEIGAGPLSQVLSQLSVTAGVSLSYAPDLVAGRMSSGVKGNFTPAQALERALAGSGIRWRFSSDNAVVLEAAIEGSTILPTIQIEGQGGFSSGGLDESGYSPVNGYVATQSITAGKTSIPLIETPQSVNIVTLDQLTIQNAESLNQALQYTPGISPMGSESTTSDGMIIRGFNVTGSAPMYLNGSKLTRNTFSGVSEPYALERIEILKGPSSVLYGNAAPGGIINMVSKLPHLEREGELKIQGGSFNRRQLAGDTTGALGDDGDISYRLTGLTRRSDTMTESAPDDRDFLQGSVRWQPDDDTSLTFIANYQNNDTAYVYGLPAEGTVLDNINGDIDRDRFVGEPGFNEFITNNHTLGYLFSHEFSDQVAFRQNLLYFDSSTDYADIWIGVLDASQRIVSRGAYARDDDDSSWSIDNQLEIQWGSGDIRHTTLFGLDYSSQVFERAQFNGAVAGLDLYSPVYGSMVTLSSTPASHWKQDSQQLGFYAQDHIKMDEHWVVMLGGRYDKIKSETKDELTGINTEDYNDNAFTGRLGLVYLIDNGLAPYISYSESFEPASGQDFNGSFFKPTEGEQYEVGIRYQPAAQKLLITASIYQLTQSNVTTTDLDNPGYSIQEGEVKSKGVELEAKANLANNLNLIASYSRIDNAVTRSNSGTEGNRYGSVPNYTAALWLDYMSTQGLGFGAGIRNFGESTNLANTYGVSGYTVVDAVVSYHFMNSWNLALNLTNLFDEKYATCTYACFYGEERSAVATATYSW